MSSLNNISGNVILYKNETGENKVTSIKLDMFFM
jgi:hypothetical protein